MPLIFLPIKSELTSVLFDRWLVGDLAPTDEKVHVPKVFRSMELYICLDVRKKCVQTHEAEHVYHILVCISIKTNKMCIDTLKLICSIQRKYADK